ncbi:MAG: amidohydrolase [Spirochaetes bacterium]|nr:amidohydrolase [Spirochaetota bacterium]
MGPDLVLFNGIIHTMDPAAPIASAVAIRSGRIMFVGIDEDARAALGANPAVVNLERRCVVPGLTDAHLHFRWYAESLDAVDAEMPTLEQALERVAEKARRAGPGVWVTGSGWNHNVWTGQTGAGGFPTRQHLDRVAPRNPVALKAKSGHAMWVNSMALERAGISAATSDPVGGKIVRESTGDGRSPSGILLENALALVQAAIPAPSPRELARAMKRAQAALHRVGLTGIHDYDGVLAFQALQEMEASGELTLRVVKGIPRELLDEAIALGLRTGFGGERLSIGALKMFADGALGPQTAWMLEPYEGTRDGGCGIPTLTEDQMTDDIRRANASGISCAVHAIGDAACRAMLNACEKAASSAGGPARGAPRNRLEHAQLLHPDDLPRLAQLGVIASMQPLHATSDMLIADRHWGARCAGAYAWRSLLQSGARLAFGSDCPVEIPDPLAGIHAAVTRRRADGSPGPDGWRPEQKLTVEEAVRAYTVGAAYAAGRERERGQIASGMLADLTVLDRDIFAIEPHAIRETKVSATVVDGIFVHRAF